MPSPRRKKWTITLAGDITVAFRRVEKEWYATALEFDIMGYGSSKSKAFTMLQELLEIYLIEMAKYLANGDKVKFFNPSKREEWNSADEIGHYNVTFVIRSVEEPPRQRLDERDLGHLIDFIDSLDQLDMQLVEVS